MKPVYVVDIEWSDGVNPGPIDCVGMEEVCAHIAKEESLPGNPDYLEYPADIYVTKITIQRSLPIERIYPKKDAD